VVLSLTCSAQETRRAVTFFTEPAGARVFLEVSGNRGGDYIGLSGQRLEVDLARFSTSGSLDVRFELQGYRSEVRNIKSLYFVDRDRFPEEGVVRLEPLSATVWVKEHAGEVLSVVLGGLLAAALVWRMRQGSRRTESSLKESLRRISEQEQRLRKMTSDLIQAREDGRQQMAHDLHDGLLQFLVATELHLENVRDEVGDENRDLARALHGLRAATVEGRRLIRQLGPAPLERGLEAGVGDLIRSLQQDGWDISSQLQIPPELPEHVGLAAFRILQEALNNVRKHSGGPGTVHVEVQRQLAGLRLNVKDQGRGFTLENAPAGVGLTSMRSRAESVGGRLSIVSQPGQGTTVEAWLPTYSPDPGEY